MQNTSTSNIEGLGIDITILKDSNLSLQEKFTLAIIKALDKNNGCFASNKYFADILQVSSKRASDIIQALITKNYITSTIENFYKRTIRVVNVENEQVEQEVPTQPNQPHQKPKKKPMMWRGADLSTWAADTIERMKKRFPEIEILLSGGSVDESKPATFRTNEELANTYREAPSEWQGVNQLQFI